MADFTPIDRMKSYQAVAEQMQDQILEGKLQAGDRLPGERQLSELFGVGRTTVREALRVMEALGIIEIQGTGPDSGPVVVSGEDRVLSRWLKLQVALRNYSFDEVVEARAGLESYGARIAAMKNVPTASLSAILDDLDREERVEPFTKLDAEFHVTLTGLTENGVLNDFMQAIRHAIRQRMLEAFIAYPDWGALANRARTEHRGILEAVQAGDPSTAAELAYVHVRSFYDDLKDALEKDAEFPPKRSAETE